MRWLEAAKRKAVADPKPKKVGIANMTFVIS